MNRVGMHLRLNDSLVDVARKAEWLGCRFFQCFFLRQTTNKLISPTSAEIAAFIDLRRELFDALYVHGSYWINLASLKHNGMRVFKKELALAKKLEFTHMILHPGSAKGALERMYGIDALAKVLNKLLRTENSIQLVLENTVHGNLTVGSDIYDFKLLLEKLDHPEKISFCVDTSHAFAYGYDIASDNGQDAFIDLLDEVIGIEKIVMIHLNDTRERIGSRIDRHEIVGQGKIGEYALKRFINHIKLSTIPIILEAPVMTDADEKRLLEVVRGWCGNKR